MIDKKWLQDQANLIIEYCYEHFLLCRCKERALRIEISGSRDDSYSTGIFFLENDICIFHFWEECIDIELSKELLVEWLIKRISHNNLVEQNKNIIKEEIYDSYLKGENAVIEYYWQDVKAKLQRPPYKFSTTGLIEALELSSNSPVLKNCIPYISVGRLCLSKTKAGQPYSSDCLCINIINDRIEVASYQHQDARLFDKAFEAVKYIESFY